MVSGQTPFVNAAKTETMLADFNRLRKAIRNHDPEATEAAWDRCERWVGCINPTAAPKPNRFELDPHLQSVLEDVQRAAETLPAPLHAQLKAYTRGTHE